MSEALAASIATILVAELGDKTQLATVALTAASRSPVRVFLGALLGFVVADVVAVAAGAAAAAILPLAWAKVVSGLAFIAFGLVELARRSAEATTIGGKSAFFATAAFVASMEFGDKTQLAAFALTTYFGSPIEIILGAAIGAAVATAAAVALGSLLGRALPITKLRAVAGFAFIAAGAYLACEGLLALLEA